MKKRKKTLNKKQYRKMLDSICLDYCSEENDCVLKEFLVSAHPSPRLLMQMKCVERFKITLANETGKKVKEIGWTEAMTEWVARGHAEKFASLYSEDIIRYDSIYKKTMNEDDE